MSGCAISSHFLPVPLIMRLMSSGKTEITLDGREMSCVILILKFSRQHQPQRAHEKPDLSMDGAYAFECVWIRRSILRLREAVSMNKHRQDWNI